MIFKKGEKIFGGLLLDWEKERNKHGEIRRDRKKHVEGEKF